MEVLEDFESRPYNAVSSCGQEREGDNLMERTEAVEGAAWLRWREVARKKHKKRKAKKKER